MQVTALGTARQAHSVTQHEQFWWLVLLVTVFGGVLGFGVAAGSSSGLWLVGVGTVLLLVRLRCGTFLTPVAIPMTVLPAAALFGERSNAHPGYRTGVSYNVFLSQRIADQTTGVMMFCAIAFGVGALICLPARRDGIRRVIDFEIDERWLTRIALASWIPSLLIVATIRGQLLERRSYLVGSQGGIFSLASALILPAIVLFGFVASASKGQRRYWAVVGALSALIISFALGSRRAPLWFALYFGGIAMRRRDRRSVVILILASAASFWLLRVPLVLRGNGDRHGLVPYTAILGKALFMPTDGNGAADNLIAGYPITGSTAFLQPRLPLNWLVTQLNPVPGQLAGFYDISPHLRLNAATPYSALGELGNYGHTVAGVVCTLTGAVFGYFERRLRWMAANGRQFMAVAYLGLVGLFSIQLLQYDLRSAWRPFWYGLILDLVLLVFPGLIGLSRPQRPPLARRPISR